MADLDLFAAEGPPTDPHECVLAGRRYRVTLVHDAGVIHARVEVLEGAGWREVRWAKRRRDVIVATGLGRVEGEEILLTEHGLRDGRDPWPGGGA